MCVIIIINDNNDNDNVCINEIILIMKILIILMCNIINNV